MSLVPPKGFDLTMENYRDISPDVVAVSLVYVLPRNREKIRRTVTRFVYIDFHIKSGPLLWARQPGSTPKVPASLGWDGASSDATKCQC